MGRFKELLTSEKHLVLHGALGTELEYQGHDVSGKLWSAKYLISQPDLIKAIHKTYIDAGSDIVTTSTYQATLPGLLEAGLSQEEAERVIALTVQLAKQAREEVWQDLDEKTRAERIYPLISGDVGPYAAYLADGSEYTGRYDLDQAGLKDFHRQRLAILVAEGVDLLALETIPNFQEVQALAELLAEEFPTVEAYLSLTSQDGLSISDGTPIKEVASYVDDQEQILALGFNCSAPAIYDQALKEIRKVSQKPLVTYPNSGEVYDGASQTWHQEAATEASLLERTKNWQELGAKIVGGCCRTRPDDIASLVARLK